MEERELCYSGGFSLFLDIPRSRLEFPERIVHSLSMEIHEVQTPISQDMADRLAVVFKEAFGTPPSAPFPGRLNEKQDLSVLVAEESGQLMGLKVGYTCFRGVFFSWLGAVLPSHQRRGIARALLQRQHGLCQERGFGEIQTEAAGSNREILVLDPRRDSKFPGCTWGTGIN